MALSVFVLTFEPLLFQYRPQRLQCLSLIRGNDMMARNSQGLLVSLLSPAPTASEVENRSQSWKNRDGSHESDTEERAHVQDEEYLEKEEVTKEGAIHKKETSNDRIRCLDPRIVTLNRTEYDEVCINLTRTGFVYADSRR